MNDIKIINDNIQTVIANKGTLGVASLRERDPALHILDEYAHFPITNPNNYAKIGFPKKNTNRDYSKEYLTYEITSNGELYLYEYFEGTYSGFDISYSLNGGEWTAMPKWIYTYDDNVDDEVLVSSDTSVSVSNGDIIKIKGNNNSFDEDYAYAQIMVSSYFNVYGNIMSIIYGDNFVDQISFPNGTSRNFAALFSNLSVIDASNLILPATVLTESCYGNMFDNCTSLINAPELPATTLANMCYWMMFHNCTSLVNIPLELPVITLADRCYAHMFENCTSLINIPSELPATGLALECYSSMFNGCTSVVNVPSILPATTLANVCYHSMFKDCTSLVGAPELPAITLESACYESMFEGCTSLTSAPELPAITLESRCYYKMFKDCSSLNYIKCLATDVSAFQCTTSWVENVSASGTFVGDPTSSWSSDSNGVPQGWTTNVNILLDG